MSVSRVIDVEMAIRKLNSRFRRPLRISRPEWPVISATRPLFYLIRFFGLAPFAISEDHFIAGSYDVIYSLFCTAVHTYVIYTSLIRPQLKRDTTVLDILEGAKVIYNYFVTILNVIMAVWNRREFIGVLNVVKNYDFTVRDLGFPRKEGATKIWAWSTCVCTTLLWITVGRLGMIAFNESWIENTSYLLGYLAVSLSTVKFSSVVLLLGQRFRHLNKIAQLNKESPTTNQKYIAIDYKVVQRLHNSLMNAGESLSRQYAWPLLLWLINLCVHSVSNLYFLIDWLMVTPVWAKTQWALVNCLAWWLVTYIVQLLLLHIACHFTSGEANNMGSIMTKRQPFVASENYSLESSLYFINRKLNFSAAGCFHVDLPLLRSTTALLTTYLVLLFQFHS